MSSTETIRSCTACTISTGGVGTAVPSLMLSKTFCTSGMSRIWSKRFVDELAHVHADQPQHGVCGGHVFDLQKHRLARIGRVLLDHAVEVGIDVRQRGNDHRGQTREEAAVEAAERMSQVADRGAEHRADDVQLGRV